MRRRDKFFSKLLPARAASPGAGLPSVVGQPSTQQVAATTTSTPSNPTISTAATPPATPLRNLALELAIQKYIDKIPDVEKQAFRDAFANLSQDTLLSEVAAIDEADKHNSVRRRHADRILKFLDFLDRFMGLAAIGVQKSPEISSMIIGGVRIVINLATAFVKFFIKLTEMLCSFQDYLGPLAEYAAASRDLPIVQNTVADIYGNLLEFCWKARNVFVDSNGQTRRFKSFLLFLRIQWEPFETGFGEIESNIQHQLGVLLHASQASLLNDSLKAKEGRIRAVHQEHLQERESFLNWISQLEFEKTHEEIYSKKHEGTGEWLLNTPEFQSWLNSPDSSLLWCHGAPGAGKSVLASNVLEYVTNKHALDAEIGIGFAFYNYQAPELRDPSLIIAAFLKQLCRKKASVPSWLLKIKQDAFNPFMASKLDSFVSLAQTFQETILIIDALDECPKDDRHRILEFISKVISDLPRAKIFVTSRREADIVRAFEEGGTPTIEIQAKNTEADISLYVNSEVSRLRRGVHGKKLFLRDETLEADIIDTLTQESNGMFLWVNLQLENLCRVSEAKKDSLVKSALRELPKGLDETYTRIMEQVCSQHQYMRDLALTAFKWVLWAKRPLYMFELEAVVALRGMDKSPRDIDMDEQEIILEACGNLLVEKSGKAAMLHFSVNEFLLEQTFMSWKRLGFEHLSNGKRVHTELALTCLYRLLLDDATHSLSRWPDFKSYAACWFDYHVLQGKLIEEDTEYINRLLGLPEHNLAEIFMTRLNSNLLSSSRLRGYEQGVFSLTASDFIYGTTLFQLSTIRERWTGSAPPKFALPIAASSGNLEAVKYLVEQGCEIDQKLDENATALYYASSGNHIATTEFLLDKGADINAIGGTFGTALQAAVGYGSQGTLSLLLNRGADTNVKAGIYGNALQTSVAVGNADTTKLLLDAGAGVNAHDGQYELALQAAAQLGFVRIVELLLDNGANANLHSGFLERALKTAARPNNAKVVALLLDRGADVNAQCGDYGYALQAAAMNCGDGTVMLLLLESGADVNLVGGKYGSALTTASYFGDENAVKILIERGANVNLRIQNFGTALEIAIKRGHKNIAELLRSNGAV